ncbi:hypothetical protein M1M34_gp106 [Haloarcula tailed virus 2]|uniref:Uncharacterized protein n=1 Tax=Haloarcula tailed virus 2 TaxID=2877989 RepID=A0AAE8XZW8_9CAUD|nr:hypothetical protein M1M34_gp106 [Haloarcula tailed virus 2]UBF23227.1 hypothetical protein HATV-2_gp76 [Haloarcula tailed virus 2]
MVPLSDVLVALFITALGAISLGLEWGRTQGYDVGFKDGFHKGGAK